MRLLSFRIEERSSFGALIEGKIVDLGRHMPDHPSLRGLLEANALVRALDTAAEVSAEYRLDEVTLLPPVPNPGLLLCTFDDLVSEPVLIDPKFLRGDSRPLPIPTGAANPLAAGMGMVISRSGQPDEAGRPSVRIAGVTHMAYLSPGSLSMGPWLVTPDEFGSVDGIAIKVTVGEQSIALSLPISTDIVERLSARYELATGDTIGVLHYLPDLPLYSGVTIEVSSTEIGTLKNPVRHDEAPRDAPQ